MGRRKKAAKKAPKKKKQVVASTFKCPFCAHSDAVECKMDRDRNIGYVQCRICNADFQTPINYLSEPIDVFSDWLDECEQQENKEIA